MNISPTQEEKWLNLRHRLTHLWLVWGLLPLAFMLVLMLAVASPEASASPDTMDQQHKIQVERRTQAFLAISALLFFVAFSADGRSTDDERVGRRILRAAGGDAFRPSRAQLAAQAHLAFAAVNRTAVLLTTVGLLMSALAVAAVLARLPLTSGLQILALAAVYQLFVFSRHPYYDELIQSALTGELVEFDDENDAKPGK